MYHQTHYVARIALNSQSSCLSLSSTRVISIGIHYHTPIACMLYLENLVHLRSVFIERYRVTAAILWIFPLAVLSTFCSHLSHHCDVMVYCIHHVGYVFCESSILCIFFLSLLNPSWSSCCKVGLVVLSFLRFCLSWKICFPLLLKDSFAEYSNLDWQLFSFTTGNVTFCTLFACKAFAEKSPLNLMALLLNVI